MPLQTAYTEPTGYRVGTRILLVDDDIELASLLSARFEREGFRLNHAIDGAAALDWVQMHQHNAALVLLDLMLPDMPGIEVFKRLRARSPDLPVIMLTAKGDPVDRVVGLELGADDYVAKPFDPRELIARIRAVMRRTVAPARQIDAVAAGVPCDLGAAQLDVARRTVVMASGQVSLTPLEFRLLLALARHPRGVLSREALTASIQAGSYQPLERAVDVQVARLRRKLRQVDTSAEWIVTARGEGYCWAPPREPT